MLLTLITISSFNGCNLRGKNHIKIHTPEDDEKSSTRRRCEVLLTLDLLKRLILDKAVCVFVQS